jgi:hypothetical protein
MCYECSIPDIDDHHKLIIVCMNFKVTKAPANPFEDQVAPMHTGSAKVKFWEVDLSVKICK